MSSIIHFNSYSKEYAFLSNFFPAPFLAHCRVRGGQSLWVSSEQYYQAQKMKNDRDYLTIAESPFALTNYKKLGLGMEIVPSWEDLRLQVMRIAVREKFHQNLNTLGKLLVLTGDAELVERAPWDGYWGDGQDGSGVNMMGKLLEEVRYDLREKLERS